MSAWYIYVIEYHDYTPILSLFTKVVVSEEVNITVYEAPLFFIV